MGIPVDNEEKLSLVHVWPGNGRLPTISKPILVLKQKTDVEIESGYLPTNADLVFKFTRLNKAV